MSYEVILTDPALKALKGIEKIFVRKIRQKIDELADNPRPSGCKKLKGSDAYRIRIGDYRVIYEIVDNKLLVIVIRIGHRRDIYD